MTEIQGTENRDMYKSYIQKRRVVPEKTEYDSDNEHSLTARNIFDHESGEKTEKSAITDAEELSILREKYRPEEDFSDYSRKPEEKSTYSLFRLFTPKSASIRHRILIADTHHTISNRHTGRSRQDSHPTTGITELSLAGSLLRTTGPLCSP